LHRKIITRKCIGSIKNGDLVEVKWEQGNKKPAGASKKLLDIIERKGLEALI